VIFRTVLSLIAAVALTACGGAVTSQTNSPAPAPMPTPTPTPAPNPPPGPTPMPSQPTDITTYKYDVSRSGQNVSESVLTTSNVKSSSFGLVRFLATDGKVDAQPLYLSKFELQGATHDVVFVATENDSVYAFDADSGAVLWKVSLLGSGEAPSDPLGCGQVIPQIGVTSTPVIDRSAGAHGVLYAVAMSARAGSYFHRLHALDLGTGAEVAGSPVTIAPTFPNAGGSAAFEPQQYEERAALLLSHGTIYTSFTSHCDGRPYSGWVVAFKQSTLAQTAVFNAAPNSGGGGPAIWMAGGGPAADAAGNVYLLTANGTFETALTADGFPAQGDYGNSFLKLDGATLRVVDYFTMHNAVAESQADTDLGSGGIMLLPDATDSANVTRHLAVGAGKDGNLYVVNRDSMGKFNPATNNIWQELDGALAKGIWSTPAYFNQRVYYGPSGGAVTAFAIHDAKLTLVSAATRVFPYPGSAISVSANGTSNAIVWAHENTTPGILRAYDANDLTKELYNSAQANNGQRDQFGPGNKFITPVVADGRVLVGTQTGVAVFGLLN
jgi:outer membrane protein assembly factor BamB